MNIPFNRNENDVDARSFDGVGHVVNRIKATQSERGPGDKHRGDIG